MEKNKKLLIESILKENVEYKEGYFFDTSLPFLHEDHTDIESNDERESIITLLKEFFKKNDRLYYLIVHLISPTYFNISVNKIRDSLIKQSTVCTNIGSGNKTLDRKIVNIDLFQYKNVDVVSDATKLCIKDNCVDLVINEVNIEHIYEYKRVVSESFRILKKGATSYYLIPFTEGFHASPHDYHRFTHKAIEKLFEESGFSKIQVGVYAGPTSGFLWILIEFLSTLLSFNIKKLYEIWTIIFMVILWPLKFLDILLNHFETGKNIASVFYVIAKK